MSMVRFDLHNNISVKNALNSQSVSTNTTVNGNIIDLLGFGALEFAIFQGAYTDGTYTYNIQEGNASNLSDAAITNASNVFGSLPAVNAVNGVARVGYRVGAFRYVRLQVTSTGVTTGANVGAIAILGAASQMPTV